MGQYRSVKFFDDIVHLLASGAKSSCGITGECQPQLVIEADGSTYPCDFYCLDEFTLGNIRELGIVELYQRSSKSPSKKRDPLPKMCSSCGYIRICGGNCKRMQKNICCAVDDTYCGYKEFLDNNIQDLTIIAKNQRMYRN